MRSRSAVSHQKKPLFSRRFLWLIILLLLFLIPLLDRMGPSDAFLVTAPSSGEVQTRFDIADLAPEQQRLEGVPVTWLALPDSDHVRVSVLTDRQPLENPSPPPETQLNLEARHGLFVATLRMPFTTSALEDGTRFLNLWLPATTDRTRYVISGNLDQDRVDAIVEQLAVTDAPSAGFDPAPRPAVTRLSAPVPGGKEYLAFALATDILRQRFSGYNVQLSRDDSQRAHQALVNSTLDPNQRALPSEDTFEQALANRLDLQPPTTRSAQELHQDILLAAAYDLSADTQWTRPERWQEITYDDFVTQWEALFGSP